MIKTAATVYHHCGKLHGGFIISLILGVWSICSRRQTGLHHLCNVHRFFLVLVRVLRNILIRLKNILTRLVITEKIVIASLVVASLCLGSLSGSTLDQ